MTVDPGPIEVERVMEAVLSRELLLVQWPVVIGRLVADRDVLGPLDVTEVGDLVVSFFNRERQVIAQSKIQS